MITLKKVKQRAERDAKSRGYYLNPDLKVLDDILEGLKQNEDRYGYPLCPCRLSAGTFEFDRDIICPCDYRDPDVEEHGCCYCALYVRKDVFERKTSIVPIPERRPIEKQLRAYTSPNNNLGTKPLDKTTVISSKPKIEMKMWYCKQCGYVCFREEPPYVCPICKAKREMFNEMKIKAEIKR